MPDDLNSPPLSTRGLLRRYWRLFAPYKTALAAAVFCMLMVGALEPLLPWLLGALLDINRAGEELPVTVLQTPFIFLLIVVLRGAFIYGRAYLSGWLEATIQKDLRNAAAARFLFWRPRRAMGESAANVTSHIVFFTGGLAKSMMSILTVLLQETVKLFGYTALLFYTEWRLALILLVAMPPIVLFTRYFNRRVRKKSKLILQKNVQSADEVNEIFRLWKIVKIQGGEEKESSRLRALFSRMRSFGVKKLIAKAASQPASQIILALPCSYIVYYAADSLQKGTLSPGDVVTFMSAMLLMQAPVRNLIRSLSQWAEVSVTARSVFAFLESPLESDDGKKTIERARGDIAFERLSFVYDGAKKPALDNVSFSVAAKETVALVGKSGAGKTTLANLLPRFYQQQTGTLRVDGTDIRELTLHSLRKQIALVTQEPLLFNDTVANNVAYPKDGEENPQKVLRALENAAALEFVNAMPGGVNAKIGEGGGKLSGGQKQRLALARAFYKDAPIIILDEATSSLDSETELQIKEAMRRLLAGRTAIIIAHRFATIDFADRVVVLDDGKLLAQGATDELLKTCPLFANLYRAQKLK